MFATGFPARRWETYLTGLCQDQAVHIVPDVTKGHTESYYTLRAIQSRFVLISNATYLVWLRTRAHAE